MLDYIKRALYQKGLQVTKGEGIQQWQPQVNHELKQEIESERNEAFGVGESSGPPSLQLPPMTLMPQIKVEFSRHSILPMNDRCARVSSSRSLHPSVENLAKEESKKRRKRRRPQEKLEEDEDEHSQVPKMPKKTTQQRRMKE